MLRGGFHRESELEALQHGHAGIEEVALEPMLDVRPAFDFESSHSGYDRKHGQCRKVRCPEGVEACAVDVDAGRVDLGVAARQRPLDPQATGAAAAEAVRCR